jgi:hypothetical protein
LAPLLSPRLSQEIIVIQQQEIAAMRPALGQLAASCASAGPSAACWAKPIKFQLSYTLSKEILSKETLSKEA